MTVVALPDVLGALLARLLGIAEVAALAGTNVSARFQKSWTLPGYAILLERAGGLVDNDVPLAMQRVQVTCYGPTGHDAMTLWRTVHPALLPWDGARSFVGANGCHVASIVHEGGPTSGLDGDGLWPYVRASYAVRYRGN